MAEETDPFRNSLNFQLGAAEFLWCRTENVEIGNSARKEVGKRGIGRGEEVVVEEILK